MKNKILIVSLMLLCIGCTTLRSNNNQVLIDDKIVCSMSDRRLKSDYSISVSDNVDSTVNDVLNENENKAADVKSKGLLDKIGDFFETIYLKILVPLGNFFQNIWNKLFNQGN